MKPFNLFHTTFLIFFFGLLNLTQSQWVQVSSILRSRVVLCYVSNDKYKFAGTQGDGIYRSLKNSENWVRISENSVLDDLNINALVLSGKYIYAGTKTSGLYFSENNGENWSVTNLTNQTINSLFTQGDYVFAGLAQNKGVYRSNIGSKIFIPLNTGLSSRTIYSFTANEKYLFTGTGSEGVFFSSNNGDLWVKAVLSNNVLAIFSLAVNKNFVYAGTEGKGLYYSSDSGITWKKSSFNGEGTIYSFTPKDSYLFAGTYQKGICVLECNGELIGEDYYDDPHGTTVRSLWLNNNHIFAGTMYGVIKRKLAGPYLN